MKAYISGFSKGVGIMILLLIASTLAYDAFVSTKQFIFYYLFSISSFLLLLSYLIRKHKLSYSWVMIGLVFGALALPFLYGFIEHEKSKKQK